jgi:hypothetical protein
MCPSRSAGPWSTSRADLTRRNWFHFVLPRRHTSGGTGTAGVVPAVCPGLLPGVARVRSSPTLALAVVSRHFWRASECIITCKIKAYAIRFVRGAVRGSCNETHFGPLLKPVPRGKALGADSAKDRAAGACGGRGLGRGRGKPLPGQASPANAVRGRWSPAAPFTQARATLLSKPPLFSARKDFSDPHARQKPHIRTSFARFPFAFIRFLDHAFLDANATAGGNPRPRTGHVLGVGGNVAASAAAV